jgi:hypothetical protein
VSKTNGDKFAVLKTWPIFNWAWPKIVVFVPLTPALPYADEVLPHFFDIFNGGVPFFNIAYGIPDMVRNKAGQALKESQFTHVLMLDTDHKHPSDIIQRLARRVIEDPERLVVAALAHRRGEPYDPMMWVKKDDGYYNIEEWEPGSLQECDVVATPAMLIHRNVFETLPPPWFFYDYEDMGPEMNRHTEDLGFCNKVRAAGIKIYCDTSITTPHMRSGSVDGRTWQSWKQTHPDEYADPVIEKKARAIAERLNLTTEQMEAKVKQASVNVKASWDKANPQTREQVERWYGSEDSGYFFDLLYWNLTPLYKSIVEPLKEIKGKNVLVIGPGIGGEIDALVKGGNAISVYDVPGALLDFVRDYYGEKINIPVYISGDHDLIVAVDVIEHIHPAGLASFLNSLLHALDTGGSLYCHCNFVMQDIYPMHYAENEQPFREWLSNNFQQTGDLTYQKLPVKVAA